MDQDAGSNAASAALLAERCTTPLLATRRSTAALCPSAQVLKHKADDETGEKMLSYYIYAPDVPDLQVGRGWVGVSLGAWAACRLCMPARAPLCWPLPPQRAPPWRQPLLRPPTSPAGPAAGAGATGRPGAGRAAGRRCGAGGGRRRPAEHRGGGGAPLLQPECLLACNCAPPHLRALHATERAALRTCLPPPVFPAHPPLVLHL